MVELTEVFFERFADVSQLCLIIRLRCVLPIPLKNNFYKLSHLSFTEVSILIFIVLHEHFLKVSGPVDLNSFLLLHSVGYFIQEFLGGLKVQELIFVNVKLLPDLFYVL